MIQGTKAIKDDLRTVFGYFPLACLLHLRANRHRLIRGKYFEDGRGCMFYLLSEVLPAEERIDRPAALTRHFTGRSGYPACEEPQYQPARWLVRLIDGLACPRYGMISHLSWNTVFRCLERAIAQRIAAEQEARQGAQRTPPRLGQGDLVIRDCDWRFRNDFKMPALERLLP